MSLHQVSGTDEARRPFEPVDGKTARWRKLYDLVLAKRENEEITYREVEDLLDCDRAVAQGSMLLAAKHLEEDGKHTVRTVHNFGWVVMRPAEHIGAAESHLKKARRQAVIVLRKVDSVGGRRRDLSQFERESLDRLRLRANLATEITGRSKRSLAEISKLAIARTERRRTASG